jgi:hypothetical protein
MSPLTPPDGVVNANDVPGVANVVFWVARYPTVTSYAASGVYAIVRVFWT